MTDKTAGYRKPAFLLQKRRSLTDEADCIFNAGVVKYHGQYVMAFRNDYQFDGVGAFAKCVIGLAFSQDGIHWKVQERPFLTIADMKDPDVTKVYAPRLTVIEDQYETEGGFRTNVIFPGGLILEEDGTAKIYYGASDTVECMATAKVEDLIALCRK